MDYTARAYGSKENALANGKGGSPFCSCETALCARHEIRFLFFVGRSHFPPITIIGVQCASRSCDDCGEATGETGWRPESVDCALVALPVAWDKKRQGIAKPLSVRPYLRCVSFYSSPRRCGILIPLRNKVSISTSVSIGSTRNKHSLTIDLRERPIMSRKDAQRGQRNIFRSRLARKGNHFRPSVDPLESRQLLSVNWTSPTSGSWDVASNWSTNTVPGPGDDVDIDVAGVTVTIGSNVESVHSVTADDPLVISGGGLKVAANSTISGGLSMTGGSLTANGSGTSLTVTGTTTISGASLYAQSGSTLSLPNLTSYTSDNNTFQADGAKSVLDASGLTNVTQQGPWDINATNGGTLNLGGMTSLTCTNIISVTDTGGSTLNLGGLTSLTSTLSFGYGISITDTGDSTLLDGKLTSLTADQLAGIVVTLDGTDAHVADSWSSFTDSNLNVTGGATRCPV